jgi:hypothetical protein
MQNGDFPKTACWGLKMSPLDSVICPSFGAYAPDPEADPVQNDRIRNTAKN